MLAFKERADDDRGLWRAAAVVVLVLPVLRARRSARTHPHLAGRRQHSATRCACLRPMHSATLQLTFRFRAASRSRRFDSRGLLAGSTAQLTLRWSWLIGSDFLFSPVEFYLLDLFYFFRTDPLQGKVLFFHFLVLEAPVCLLKRENFGVCG